MKPQPTRKERSEKGLSCTSYMKKKKKSERGESHKEVPKLNEGTKQVYLKRFLTRTKVWVQPKNIINRNLKLNTQSGFKVQHSK